MSISQRCKNLKIYYFEDTDICSTPINDDDKLLVFDVDCTLYKKSAGLEDRVISNFRNFLCDKYGVKYPEKLINIFKKTYSFRIRGGFEIFGITKDDIIENVYNIDHTQFLEEDMQLKKYLDSLPYRKVIMTNGLEQHAISALKAKGIDTCFEALFSPSFHWNEHNEIFINKPMQQSYKIVDSIYGIRNRKNILFLDDQQINIDAAIKRGWSAYKVDDTQHIIQHIKNAIDEAWTHKNYSK